MINRITLLLFIGLTFWSCEEEQEVDTTPPTVLITSPVNQSYVSEIITVTCMSNDNNGIDRVELWVNGSLWDTDESEPYSFELNTLQLNDGNYMIIVRSYDVSGNSTDSEPVSLTVDNSNANPIASELYEILYYEGFQIKWSINNDDDFNSYEVYESQMEDMANKVLVYETNTISDTSFVVINTQEEKFYQVKTIDIYGLSTISNTKLLRTTIDLWGNSYSIVDTDTLIMDNLDAPNNYIPNDIGYLTNLVYFRIAYSTSNNIGEIPSEIGNLKKLKTIFCPGAGIHGSIPIEIFNLTNLEYLTLNGNYITGEIPSEIGNLTNLINIRLANNELSGYIPYEICDLNIDWTGANYRFHNNQFCPPYPSCIEDIIGEQDTGDCD